MREKFQNAVIDNFGKIIAGLIVTSMVAIFTTIVIEPVKKVVALPGEVKEWQQGFEKRQSQFESRQMQFLKQEQTRTDSTIYKQLEKLNQSNEVIKTEMAVVKTKLATIRDELPALHQRFNDIENTVKNAQSLSDFALHPYSFLITNSNEQETTN